MPKMIKMRTDKHTDGRTHENPFFLQWQLPLIANKNEKHHSQCLGQRIGQREFK